MKLLELSALTLGCAAAPLLTVGHAWDIYSTCLNIHTQSRASKILRSEAETCLRHLTLTAFSRAQLAARDAYTAYNTSTSIAKHHQHNQPSHFNQHIPSMHMHQTNASYQAEVARVIVMSEQEYVNDVNVEHTHANVDEDFLDAMGYERDRDRDGNSHGNVHGNAASSSSSSISSCLNSNGGQSWSRLSVKLYFAGPVGLKLLLCKIMNSLSHLLDEYSGQSTGTGTTPQKTTGGGLFGLGKSNGPKNGVQPSVDGVSFALSLINIALEAGGAALGALGPLVNIMRGDICRHLLRASQSDHLAVLSLALRVVFNLFVSIKDHMKVQLEVFLTSVHLRLLKLNLSSKADAVGSAITPGGRSSTTLSAQEKLSLQLNLAREELALESLLEFCREPSLMVDLYTNYDCDLQTTNLFASIISSLCARAIHSGSSRQERSPHKFLQPPLHARLGGESVYVNLERLC